MSGHLAVANTVTTMRLLLHAPGLALAPQGNNHAKMTLFSYMPEQRAWFKGVVQDLQDRFTARASAPDMLLIDTDLLEETRNRHLAMLVEFTWYLPSNKLNRWDWDAFVKATQDAVFREFLNLNDVWVRDAHVQKLVDEAQPLQFDITVWVFYTPAPLRSTKGGTGDGGGVTGASPMARRAVPTRRASSLRS